MFPGTLLLGLGLLAAPSLGAPADTPALSAGIQLVEDGDLEGAVARLEEALRGLEDAGAPPRARGRAHLYLAMAHLGLGSDEQARAHMRAVWRHDPGLTLAPRDYAPAVIALHRDVRPAAPAPSPGPRHLPALIGLGGAASVTGVALNAGGGGTSLAPPASPPPAPSGPPTLRLFNCDDECHAFVNGTPVRVVGVGVDSGPVALRGYLREGPNEIAFELVNLRAGIAYGFEVRLGEELIFQQTCGVVFRTGCENDRRYPPGLARRFVYTLFQKRERNGPRS